MKAGNVKYVFGGNNAKTGDLDCSSFTQYVFKQTGLDIGRNTEHQWTNSKGKRVDKKSLQPGDLVFFRNTYKSGHTDGVSHVGIYTGNGQFIHNGSPTKLDKDGGIRTGHLNEDYWTKHWLGAKRF